MVVSFVRFLLLADDFNVNYYKNCILAATFAAFETSCVMKREK